MGVFPSVAYLLLEAYANDLKGVVRAEQGVSVEQRAKFAQ
jgi:hypothetical protein